MNGQPGEVAAGDGEFRLDREDILLGPEDAIRVIRRSPQIPYPLHTHDFSELVIVLSGTGIHESGGERLPLSAGDVFVINGDRAHGYTDCPDLNLLNVCFDFRRLNMPLHDLTRLPGYHALFTLEPSGGVAPGAEGRLRLSPERLEEAKALADRIDEELSSGEEGRRFMAAAAFMSLAGRLCRWYSGAEKPGARDHLRVSRALVHLEKHVDRDVRLDELTGLTGLSASTLNRAFKKAVGLPPLAYHGRLRVLLAADLLRTTDLTVAQIADRTGYGSANYLSRQFRRSIGLSPTAYRRRWG